MTPHLVWHGDQRAEVLSVETLDRLLDDLTTEAATSRPFTVELQLTPETAIVLVVGADVSPVEFYDATARPPVLGCRGPWDDDTLLVFDFHGHYSELPKRFCVPIADARAATRQFLLTGVRPPLLPWNDPFRT